MPLLAVLFDLDDTLHDKSATLERVAGVQFTAFNLSSKAVTQSVWHERFLALNNERIEKAEVFRRLATEFSLPKALKNSLLADFDENLGKQACPYPGALDVLASLRQRGLKLGIVTNGRDAFQRSKIEGMGITKLIDSVVTSGGFGTKKPDPRIFAACLSELQVAPESAAFVGDDFAADMEPAIELGMLAVWKSAERSNRVTFSSNELAHIGQRLLSVA
jgi:putative hydrolase of the HAD superfamily